jgi:DNA-binding NtrC family response regulator
MAEIEQRLLMLIDDEPAQSRLITALAAREGWRTLVVKDERKPPSPRSAPARACSSTPSSSTSGCRATKPAADRRTAQDRRPALPILMLTTSASPLLAVEAMRAGATDYLVKPVAPDRLMQALRMRRPAKRRATNCPADRENAGHTGFRCDDRRRPGLPRPRWPSRPRPRAGTARC